MAFDREKILQIAQRHVERRKYDRAIVEYQKLVQQDPNDARTLLRIGDLQARLAQYPQAIATYDRVALHYAGRGFSLKAVAVLKQIRELIDRFAPELADQYSHVSPKLAQIYAELGLINDALATYDGVARRMQATGRDRDAVEIIRRMVALERSNPLSYLRLAEALCRINRLDEAMEHFWSAAQLLTQQRRHEDALKVLERILHFRTDTRVARVAAELYLARGSREAALAALSRLQICFDADPRDLDTLGLLAQAFQLIDQASKAAEVYKEMVRIASEAGRGDLAQRYVQKLLELAPDDEQVRALVSMERARPSTVPVSVEAPASHVARSSAPASYGRGRRSSDAPASLRDDEIEFLEDGSVAEAEDGADEPEVVVTSYTEAPTTPGRTGHEHEAGDGRAGSSVGPSASGASGRSVPSLVKKALVDAETYRGLRLYSKAAALLRSVLSLTPGTIEVRAALSKVLLDAGNPAGAIEEMLAIARIYLDRGAFAAAEAELYQVLELAPDLPAALNLLAEVEERTGAPAVTDAPPRSVQEHEAFELRRSRSSRPAPEPQAPPSDPDAPLPSYRLEDEVAPAAAGGSAALPRFELDADAAEAQAPGGIARASQAPATAAERDDDEVTQRDEVDTFEGATTPQAAPVRAASPQHAAPPDSLEETLGTAPASGSNDPYARVREALDEAEFFLSRGLFEDARSILLDQLQRLPDHAPLLEAMARLEAKMSAESGTREVSRLGEGTEVSGVEPLAAARSTEGPALRVDDVGARAPEGVVEGEQELLAKLEQPEAEIDVDEVFAKFKAGVKAQISDADSATHYDLGVAYKEMGLLLDAAREFEIAANDPRRQCNCLAMIGMIYQQQGDLDRAAEAYVRGLNCQYKGVEQEMSLYYELGVIYETKNDPDEAIYYLQRIARRDPNYRDVSARLAALLPRARRLSMPARAINSEQEFDRAFDDLYESD